MIMTKKNLESLKKSNYHGGKREGAGMPKGKKIKRTLEKEHALKEYKARVIRHADTLFNAQFANAKGNTYIYRVEEEQHENGRVSKRHILVTEPDEIAMVLDATQGTSGEVQGGYYIVTTEKPDNKAIDSMLDRAFGKPTQTINTEDENGDKKPLSVNININAD